jgi:hypothetical protein
MPQKAMLKASNPCTFRRLYPTAFKQNGVSNPFYSVAAEQKSGKSFNPYNQGSDSVLLSEF